MNILSILAKNYRKKEIELFRSTLFCIKYSLSQAFWEWMMIVEVVSCILYTETGGQFDLLFMEFLIIEEKLKKPTV